MMIKAAEADGNSGAFAVAQLVQDVPITIELRTLSAGLYLNCLLNGPRSLPQTPTEVQHAIASVDAIQDGRTKRYRAIRELFDGHTTIDTRGIFDVGSDEYRRSNRSERLHTLMMCSRNGVRPSDLLLHNLFTYRERSDIAHASFIGSLDLLWDEGRLALPDREEVETTQRIVAQMKRTRAHY